MPTITCACMVQCLNQSQNNWDTFILLELRSTNSITITRQRLLHFWVHLLHIFQIEIIIIPCLFVPNSFRQILLCVCVVIELSDSVSVSVSVLVLSILFRVCLLACLLFIHCNAILSREGERERDPFCFSYLENYAFQSETRRPHFIVIHGRYIPFPSHFYVYFLLGVYIYCLPIFEFMNTKSATRHKY